MQKPQLELNFQVFSLFLPLDVGTGSITASSVAATQQYTDMSIIMV
jgi:hypothetical protein